LAVAYGLTWGSILISGSVPAAEGIDSSWVMTNGKIAFAGYWYLMISLPVYQFLLFRWFWRIFIWTQLLWRLARIKPRLEPMHPDLAGGLGVLWLAQRVFVFFFMGLAIAVSAMLAHQMLYDGISLIDTRPTVIGFLIISLAFIIFPLLFFFKKILLTKNEGLVKYGALGSQLADQFDDKWIDNKRPEDEFIFGSTDPSAGADYSASFEMIKQMRPLPIDIRSLVAVVIFLLIPFIPLILLKMPLKDLLKRLLDVLV
jgi:hypothetical protein